MKTQHFLKTVKFGTVIECLDNKYCLVFITCCHFTYFPTLSIHWQILVNKVFVSISRSQKGDSSVNDEGIASDNPVVCEAVDSFMCSVAIDTTTSFVITVTVSISDAIAPQVLLRIPARPGKKGWFI